MKRKNISKYRALQQSKYTEGYTLDGSDVYIDNLKKIIRSNEKSLILDKEKIKFFEDFEYLIKDNIFKSINNVKIIDNKIIILIFLKFILIQKKKKF